MNILITGGSRGIGRACVERFTREGHAVTFLYRACEERAKAVADSTGAACVRCDVSDPAAVREALDGIGDVDVLINNAGVSSFCFFDSIDDGEWRRMIDTNLSGAFYVSREISKKMIKNKRGRIINIGSMWGKVGASCEVHYSASKAGLRGMTMALAKELGPSGITVNAIEPGVIKTDMNSELDEQTMRELCDATPLCRLGEPDDVRSEERRVGKEC